MPTHNLFQFAASRAAPEAGGSAQERDHREAEHDGRAEGREPGADAGQRAAAARSREAEGGGAGEVAPSPGDDCAQRASRAGQTGTRYFLDIDWRELAI